MVLLTANAVPHIHRYGPSAVNELLSTATCLRGLSLVHEANGDLHSYREAMKMLLSSIRCFLPQFLYWPVPWEAFCLNWKYFFFPGLKFWFLFLSSYLPLLLTVAMQRRLRIQHCVLQLPGSVGTLVNPSHRPQRKDCGSESPWRRSWLLWFRADLNRHM